MNVTMLGNDYRYGYSPLGQTLDPNLYTEMTTAEIKEAHEAYTESEKSRAKQFISFLTDTTKDVVGIVNDVKSGGSASDQKALDLAINALKTSGGSKTGANQIVAQAPVSGLTMASIGIGAVALLGLIFVLAKK